VAPPAETAPRSTPPSRPTRQPTRQDRPRGDHHRLTELSIPRHAASAVAVLVDHRCGYGLLITTWQDEDHAAGADAILDALRADALHRAHLTFAGTQTYTLVRDAKDTRLAAGT